MRMRKLAVGGMTGVGTLVVVAATAWACVSGPAVSLSTINAKPGQEVTLTGTNFRQSEAPVVRWDSLDGPVLATMAPPVSRNISGTFTVPATATPGNHVVIVTQATASGELTQMPIRALITVTPENGTTPALGAPLSAAEERPDGLLVSDDSIGTGTLVLISLGVAGVGMFIAGLAALFAGRRGQAPQAARARS